MGVEHDDRVDAGGGNLDNLSMLRTRGRLARCTTSLALATLLGCGEETGTTEPVDEVHQFAVAVAGHVCEKAAPCCEQFGLPEITDECHREMRNEVYISFIHAEGDGRVIDLAEDAKCIARFEEAMTCDELPFPFELVDVCPELFSEIPEGAHAPGDACEGIYDCASPADGKRFCLVDVGGVESTCVWLVPMVEGDECSPGNGIYGDCGDELVCGLSEDPNAPYLCRAPLEPGDACFSEGSCVDGYVCLMHEDGAYCEEALGLGEACIDTPDLCSFPNVCDVVKGVCASLPVVQSCQDAICSSELIEVCQ